jgi:hypothetical protein
MNSELALLSTAYFGNIQYYTKLLLFNNIKIEQYEHFPKQTWRNRCVILDANGPLTLSVPVKKSAEIKQLTRDVEIDYSRDWIRVHLKAFESAYRSSPFYDLLIDEIAPVLQAKPRFLLDLNNSILEITCEIIGIEQNTQLSNDFALTIENAHDFRDSIHPKPRMFRPDPDFEANPYHQVFTEKFGFMPNLSIIDLIFNEGNEAYLTLNNSILKEKKQ